MPLSTKYSQKLRDLITSMLNINPVKRPSVIEIIEIPDVKKRVINYVVGLKKNPGSQLAYEDLYLNAVDEQCKVLGIWESVQSELAQKSIQTSQLKKSRVVEKVSMNFQMKKQQKEQQLSSVIKLNENLAQKINAIEAKLRSRPNDIPTKDKVLYNKQVKKMKEIREWEQQLEEIREQNDKERKDMKEKFMRQNFQSNAVGQMLKGQSQPGVQGVEIDGYDDFAEADYGDENFGNEDSPDMKHKDFESSDDPRQNGINLQLKGRFREDTDINNLQDDELEKALNHYKHVLKTNKLNIQQLESDIQIATQKLEQGQYAVVTSKDYSDDAASQDTPFNVSDIEEGSDFEQEDPESNEKNGQEKHIGKVFENKINDLKIRCVNGLGENVYHKSYDVVKMNQSLSPEEMRPYMIGIDLFFLNLFFLFCLILYQKLLEMH